MRPLPLLGHDNAFPFEFQISPLDSDHADLKVHRKLAYRRNRLTFAPVSDGNPLLDLLHDLEIHGALIGLRYGEGTVHVYILSIHRLWALSTHATAWATGAVIMMEGIVMTITLPLEPQEEARLLAVARARGLPPDAIVRAALDRVLAEGAESVPAQAEARDLRPIWEVIFDNMKDVAPEDLARLPKDGASEIDHYLYSHPKRNQ